MGRGRNDLTNRYGQELLHLPVRTNHLVVPANRQCRNSISTSSRVTAATSLTPAAASATSSLRRPATGTIMEITKLNKVLAFIIKDGSEIRELLAYRNSAIRNQNLAEARLPIGGATQKHHHPRTEEIYYITHGPVESV